MKIIIKFLDSLKTFIGIDFLEFNIEKEITLYDILNILAQKYLQLRNHINLIENKFDVIVMLNNKIVKINELRNIVINEDSEIILLPSLIGG